MPEPLRVLFVDDDPHVLTALVRSLRSEQTLLISTAGSFDGALAVLAHTPIDVMVADHAMPGLTGTELLATVASKYPHVRRIMLTGSRTYRSHLDANAVLSKPVNREALLNAIRSTPDRDKAE